MISGRRIYKSATSSQHAVRELLILFFAQELLAPSQVLYVVEPWVSDVVVFDNRTGAFDALNAEWGKREVRLVDVFAQMATAGTHVLMSCARTITTADS